MNTTNPYRTYTLANGMRAVCWPVPSLVSYIGVVVGAGSRDEAPGLEGLAHFVEHTVFKGTRTRKSWQISSRMETVGGELNAYTSKEETVLYTAAPAGYEDRAIELLADLVANSIFPAAEIDREREVIVEEIKSYLDSPADSVYDEFEELAYAGSPLAHNILGTFDTVRSITGADCRKFIDTRYTPGRMVLYCCGPADPDRMAAAMERRFGALHYPDAPSDRTPPPPMAPFDTVHERTGHQANTITGMRIFGRKDPRRHALFLLNNHLGGPSMNSRLNRELRDKRGYVYTVDSNVALMSDTGLMFVYFGSDRSTVGKCRRIIADEIDRLAQSTMSDRAFEKIKTQYCGQLMVSSEHRENRAMSLAKSLLYYGELHDIRRFTEHVRAVTPQAMREVAEYIASQPSGTLTLI